MNIIKLESTIEGTI